jgi:hypothetical protein
LEAASRGEAIKHKKREKKEKKKKSELAGDVSNELR